RPCASRAPGRGAVRSGAVRGRRGPARGPGDGGRAPGRGPRAAWRGPCEHLPLFRGGGSRTVKLAYRCELEDHEPEDVFAWHERPGALERLTPPWGDVKVVRREGGIRDGAEVELEIGFGPTHFRWLLRHLDYVQGERFRDEQVSGPLKRWRHTHHFRAREGGGTVLEDELDVEAPLGFAGAAIAPTMVERELDRLFAFRYRRLETDLMRHRTHRDRPRLTVAITGSSGLIGTNLRHFLTTGGHRVIRVVRR